MKSRNFIWGAIAAAVLLAVQGCSGTLYNASAGSDDLYAVHNRQAIAQRQAAEAEAQKAEAIARRAKLEALLAQAEADAAQRQLEGADGNLSFDNMLADDFESAYERRLRGFNSLSYNMPSSYYNYRYGNASFYASAYDPAFYNVMVMGDQVWVEPKYITSMFGTWGTSRFSVNIGFGGPWWSGWWGDPFYNSWRWNWGWNSWYWGWDPWYVGWGWGYPHWGHHHYWGPGWGWGAPHRNPNVVYRPSYRTYNNGYANTSRPRRDPYYNSGNNGAISGPGRGNATGSYRNRNSGYGTDNSGNRYNNNGNSNSGNRYNYNNNNSNSNNSNRYNYNNGSSYNRGGSYGGGSYGGGSGSYGGGSRSGGGSGGGRNR